MSKHDKKKNRKRTTYWKKKWRCLSSLLYEFTWLN